MRFLSLFSGMGGFDLGLEMAGMKCVGQVEIDKDCLKVLEKHWPDVRRWTDVKSVSVAARQAEGRSRPRNGKGARDSGEGDGVPFADLICAGVPCQDWSVAGKRAGIEGARSGLFFEFVRIIREMREASSGRFPKYVLFENVPGLFSAASGRDFGIVLNKLAQCGAVDIAWRVVDSQHWVPQRRRRVFVVASFSPVSASGAAIGRSGQILAIAESCGGHPAAGRTAGEDVAAPLGASATSFGGQRYDLDNETYVPELSYALAANRWGGSDSHGDEGNVALQGASVRRLTPVECLRLQGFPENLTIEETWLDGLGLADGPKYRMCGNAVTVPVIEWIGRRIMAVDRG